MSRRSPCHERAVRMPRTAHMSPTLMPRSAHVSRTHMRVRRSGVLAELASRLAGTWLQSALVIMKCELTLGLTLHVSGP